MSNARRHDMLVTDERHRMFRQGGGRSGRVTGDTEPVL